MCGVERAQAQALDTTSSVFFAGLSRKWGGWVTAATGCDRSDDKFNGVF
jgi:hypothetical protein